MGGDAGLVEPTVAVVLDGTCCRAQNATLAFPTPWRVPWERVGNSSAGVLLRLVGDGQVMFGPPRS